MAGDPALGPRKRQEGYKVKRKKQVKTKAAMMLSLVLVVGGLAAVAGSFLQQMLAEKDDMKEYAELRETAQQPAGGGIAVQPGATDSPADLPAQADILPKAEKDEPAAASPETSAAPENPEQTPEVTAAPVAQAGDATAINLSAYKAQNRDFIAWLYIPGTGVNYPVVWSDDSDYYLNHTFTGRASSVGTLGQIAAILLPQNVEHGLVITVALPSDEGGQADLAKERIPGPKQDDVGDHPAQTLIALGERAQDHQVRLRHSGFDQRVRVRQFQKGGQLTQSVRYGSHRGKLKGFSAGGSKIHFVCGAVILPALIHTICE